MSSEIKATYHEIDFLLPVHRFHIRFSYVTKKGLPFIREFVLRLLHISPMSRSQIATYFGLSKLETDEAISDLIERGDIQFDDNGSFGLTIQSNGYFVELGKPPQLSTVMETGGTFSFELASFHCIGRERTNEKWKSGITIQVDNEVIATSEQLANSNFQKQFYEIVEKKYIPHIRDNEESGNPSIYTMESVNKLGQEPLRLTCQFRIDEDGAAIERDDFEVLGDSSAVHELITSLLSQSQKNNNISDVAEAMNQLRDERTRKLFNANSIDLKLFIQTAAIQQHNNEDWLFMLGPVYERNNWELIWEQFDKVLDEKKGANEAGSKELLWVAPSDAFWGATSRWSSCIEDLIERAFIKGKEKQRLFTPRLYLPLESANDRYSISKWERELSHNSKFAHGLLEGFLGGNVEILLLHDSFVVVSYHISHPTSLPVSLPLGFISTQVGVVRHIEKLTTEYVEGMKSFDSPNNLGALSALNQRRKGVSAN